MDSFSSLKIKNTIDTISWCSDFTARCDACQGIKEWCAKKAFRMLCWHSECWKDAYQTRWHTCAQAWRLFSFHCHMEGRWESNLWIKKKGAWLGNRQKTAIIPAIYHLCGFRLDWLALPLIWVVMKSAKKTFIFHLKIKTSLSKFWRKKHDTALNFCSKWFIPQISAHT